MTAQTKARIKEWGNSLGITIPKEIVIQEKLFPNQEITITIEKETTLRGFFGKGRRKKIDTQKAKDELRKEWPMK